MESRNVLHKDLDFLNLQKGCGDCGYAIRPAVNRFLTCPIKEAKGEESFELYFPRGRMNVLKSILEGTLSLSQELAEYVYQCTECGNCTEVCHQTQNENIVLPTGQWIDHVKVWDALRRDLVEAGYAPLDKHEKLIQYMKDDAKRNPYGENFEKKFEWARNLPNIVEEGDLMFFAGCTMPLRQQETLRNMAKILDAAGEKIILSKEEWCCGSVGMRIGDYDSIQELINHNVELFKNSGAKTIFTACAGCYRTLNKDYSEILGEELPFKVKHITEILIDLINNNKIQFKQDVNKDVIITYHDPCHLGRHMNLYEIPREVISKIPGTKLVEMKRNKNNAWCCGAGGGVKSQFPELAVEISKQRIMEAIESGAEVLITSCPFCIGNLKDAHEQMDPEIREKIKVIDIIDYIASKI